MRKKTSETRLLFVLITIFYFFVPTGVGVSQAESSGVLAVNNQMPEIAVNDSLSRSEIEYLGLKKEGQFSLSDIDCDILLIEVFSMYCPHCQKDAPTVNELYELTLGAEKNFAKKVRMVGIGAGNSNFEVHIFKEKYKVRFPLFSDPELKIHKDLDSVRTPYFIAVCNRGPNKGEILFSQLAGLNKPENFLDRILKTDNCD